MTRNIVHADYAAFILFGELFESRVVPDIRPVFHEVTPHAVEDYIGLCDRFTRELAAYYIVRADDVDLDIMGIHLLDYRAVLQKFIDFIRTLAQQFVYASESHISEQR